MAIVRWDKDQVVASEMVLGNYTTFSKTKSLKGVHARWELDDTANEVIKSVWKFLAW